VNTTAVTIFGVQHRFNDGFTYGQAFWITVCSTIVSTLTNGALIMDFIRTTKFSDSGT
jgi:potassium channel subfamily K, other eukaryote